MEDTLLVVAKKKDSSIHCYECKFVCLGFFIGCAAAAACYMIFVAVSLRVSCCTAGTASPPLAPPRQRDFETLFSEKHLRNQTQSKSSCRAGYILYSHFCYRVLRWRTFSEAQMECDADGGVLASVHSPEENEFIADFAWYQLLNASRTPEARENSYIDISVFLGAKRQTQAPYSSSFAWIDGSRFKYSNFQDKEPNNLSGNEDCVVLIIHKHKFPSLVGQWNDLNCSTNLTAAVCKMPAN